MKPEALTSPGSAPADQPGLELRDGVLCAAAVLLCLLLTWPVVETGINDDWCYTMLAWDFGRTGHFIYRGWASASVGWQAIWGGLAAHLLGYTYTVVRLSMWPIGLATALLYHSILRRFGLNRQHAILGTLTLVLSPLFLPLVDTFMTDIPGLFVLLLCLSLCQRALDATTERQAMGWLICAAFGNIALGTVRQIAWLGVLVMVPSCGLLLRRWKRVPWLTAGLWVFALVCVVLDMHWFKYQPYTAPEAIVPRTFDSRAWMKVWTNVWECALTLPFMCLPVLAAGLVHIGRLRRAAQGCVALIGAFLVSCLGWAPSRHILVRLSPPWTGNVLNRQGIMQGGLLFGPSRSMQAGWLLAALALFLLCSLAFYLASRNRWAPESAAVTEQTGIAEQQTRWLLLPFAAAYCLLLFPRATQFVLFDRYLLALIAVAMVFLLRVHQERMSSRLPWVSYAVVLLFASLATMGTHDLFAMERARVQVFSDLQRHGIPATAIRGGFELDAATQVHAWGYYNDPRIYVPKNAFHPQPVQPTSKTHPECNYPVQEFVPAVHPRYALGSDDSSCLAGAVIASATYRTWLPRENHRIVAAFPKLP